MGNHSLPNLHLTSNRRAGFPAGFYPPALKLQFRALEKGAVVCSADENEAGYICEIQLILNKIGKENINRIH